mgnify:FL=1
MKYSELQRNPLCLNLSFIYPKLSKFMSATEFYDIVNIGQHCVERFIDSTNTPEIKALDIELAGCSNLSAPYQVGRVNPPNHTLFYSLNGMGKIRTPKGSLTVTPGQLAILPAKQSFEVSIESERWDIIWVNLADTAQWHYLYEIDAPLLERLPLEGLHHAMELLYLSKSSEHRHALIPLIKDYLSSVAKPKDQPLPSRLIALFEHVEKQLQLNWNVKLLSERAHYSAPHLHRLCLSHFNRSPMQQVIYLRMARAKNLLLNTQWPIAYIANYVGYSNVFTFSKRFKKSEGVPPSHYREQHTQQG